MSPRPGAERKFWTMVGGDENCIHILAMRAEARNRPMEIAWSNACHKRFSEYSNDVVMDSRHHSGKPGASQRRDFALLEHSNARDPLFLLAKLIDWSATEGVAYEVIKGKMKMTKDELEAILVAKKVPRQLYSLDGLKNGECHCVVKENGSWKVVYMERGRVSDISTGLTESAAYDFIYNEFSSMYGWAA